MRDVEVWNKAEKTLEDSLNAFGQPWTVNPQDGAFYSPKIDNNNGCALKALSDRYDTIRFNLSYIK